MTTPQFLGIGTGSIDLQSLKAVGDDASESVYIQTLDFAGRTVDSYMWCDWAAEEPCWVDDGFEPIEGVSFTAGQGLWVQGAATTQGLQSAGKVGTEDVVITLKNGATGTGNPFPVSIDLQDIVAEGDGVSESVYIQTLDFAGRTVDSYMWCDWAAEEPCWVDDGFEPIEGVTFEPGQGLWIQATSTEQSVRFPAPEL